MVLTLSPSSKLLIDLKHYKLLVKKNGGVLIKKTATLRQLLPKDTEPNINYIHSDHLSSANVITDSAGKVVQLLDYYPYGSKRIEEGSFNEQRRYIGEVYDSDTGLNYLNARYYNGTTGRFISQDPAFINLSHLQTQLTDPQSWNSYSYARNNPLRYYDPNGKWFKDFIMGRQSWNSFAVEVGDAANYLYDNSGTWQTAMDHPYATGAVVGVAGGVAAVGGAALAEAAAPVASEIISGITPGKAITGATINIGSKYIEGKLDNRDISASEYAVAGITGAIGTSSFFKGYGKQMGYAALSNLSTQIGFKGLNNVDKTSVVISGLSSGLTTRIMGVPSQNAAPQIYRFITEQVLVWNIDTAGQTINLGVKNSEKK